MAFLTQLIVIMAVVTGTFLSTPALAYSGNFQITNLSAESPSQANPTSTLDSFVSFDVFDQDTPDIAPLHCGVSWGVGLTPPSTPAPRYCANDSYSLSFPTGTYGGVANFTIALQHQYIDNSVGQYPYNVLTKFAHLNLAYGDTVDYECDLPSACCNSCDGATITAVVDSAVA